MKLYGTLQDNLEAAVVSARRLRESSVYPATIAYWHELIAFAWHELGDKTDPRSAICARLATDLENEIASR